VSGPLDSTTREGYVEFEGSFYPVDQIGPDRRPLPLSEEVASEIRRIIEADLEANPEAKRIWIAEAERVRRELEHQEEAGAA